MFVTSYETLEKRLPLTADPLVILPLGDSIVQGEYHPDSEVRRNFGYRAALQEMLIEDGVEFDFVGSQANRCRDVESPQLPFAEFDPDHEGHWGWTTQQILNGRSAKTCGVQVEGKLADWLNSYEAKPDVVLLHLGLNDVIQALPADFSWTSNDLTDRQISEIGSSIQSVAEELLGAIDSPDFRLLVAKLHPGTAIRFEVEAVNAWLEQAMKNTERLTLVDQFDGFDPESMTYDGLHPNPLGQEFMAQRWFDAIQTSTTSSVNITPPRQAGDLNADGIIDVADIELMQCVVIDPEKESASDTEFDLTGDSIVDESDLIELVEVEIGTRRGDADLDGVIGFDDFLVIAKNYGQSGKWSSGDFTNDGLVGFLDFLHVARNFNWESSFGLGKTQHQ